MLKIGDFAKLTRVSIRMLRHYDELGLLSPASVDAHTGYRYYTVQQLPRLNRILALHDLGFSLEQVKDLLQEDLPFEQLKGMLRLKQAELQNKLLAEQERLARVAGRLEQIEREQQSSPYDVILKEVPPQLIASVRDVISGYPEIGTLFTEVLQHLGLYRSQGLAVALWHDDTSDERRIDAEAAICLNARVPETSRVTVSTLPSSLMASVVHHGPFLHLNQAYQAVVHWIATHRYRIVGPNRELYLHYTLPPRLDDPSYVTELQFPIERAEPSTSNGSFEA